MNRRTFVTTVAAIPVLAPGCRRTEPPDDGPRVPCGGIVGAPGETFDLNGRVFVYDANAPVLHGEIVPSPMVDSHVMAAYYRQVADYERGKP